MIGSRVVVQNTYAGDWRGLHNVVVRQHIPTHVANPGEAVYDAGSYPKGSYRTRKAIGRPIVADMAARCTDAGAVCSGEASGCRKNNLLLLDNFNRQSSQGKCALGTELFEYR